MDGLLYLSDGLALLHQDAERRQAPARLLEFRHRNLFGGKLYFLLQQLHRERSLSGMAGEVLLIKSYIAIGLSSSFPSKTID